MLKKPPYFPLILTSLFLPLFLYSSDNQIAPNTPPGIYVISYRLGQPRRFSSMEQTTLAPRRLTFNEDDESHNTTSQDRRILQANSITIRVIQTRQEETARELLRAQSRQEFTITQQVARQKKRSGASKKQYPVVPHSTAPTRPGTPVPKEADPSNELGNVVQALPTGELIQNALSQLDHLEATLEKSSPYEEVIFFDPTDQVVPTLLPTE